MLNQRLILPITLLAMILSACGTAPSKAPKFADINAELEQTLAALSPKARLQELDSRAVAASDPAKRAYFQLLAMELLMEYGRADNVRERLAGFSSHALDKDHLYRLDLLKAQIALANNQAPLALQKLPKYSADYPIPVQAIILRTRGIALAKLGYQEESLKLRLLLDELYQKNMPGKTTAIEDNHQIIWSSLQAMPNDTLQTIQKEYPVLRGWIELSQAVNNSGDNSVERELAVAGWQHRFPKHPAAATLAQTLRGHRGLITKYPTSIALLLPLSGRYSAPATAIRDGFLAAYFNHDIAEKPAIRIYDSGESNESILQAYKAAVSEGAKLVVGPLQKTAVSELADNKNLPVPVLALNYAEDNRSSPQVIQFGLLPEDEARQAAELAIIKDQTHAIVYAPNTKFGERLAQAFSERYTELGGKLLATETYAPDSADHEHPIKRSLNILQSENRHSILSSVIKRKTEFEPRRREDADAIFLIVDPKQARYFRAQLKFHDAGDISVYATSDAYSGLINPQKDKDLDGLIFTDMPWTLQGQHNQQFSLATQLWPGTITRFPRLYALGLDAYRIVPYLARLRANPFERFSGLTGSIALDERNRVHRELLWATFNKGQPEIMEFASAETHTLTDFEDDGSFAETP